MKWIIIFASLSCYGIIMTALYIAEKIRHRIDVQNYERALDRVFEHDPDYYFEEFIQSQERNQLYGNKKEQKNVSHIQLKSKDSVFAIRLFESYLGYSMEYADSNAKETGAQRKESSESFHQNRLRIDSVFRQCIRYVNLRNYDKLLTTLEKERINIYGHPGNMLDNEQRLVSLFEKMYNQKFAEQKDSLNARMKSLYDFANLHHSVLLEMEH